MNGLYRYDYLMDDFTLIKYSEMQNQKEIPIDLIAFHFKKTINKRSSKVLQKNNNILIIKTSQAKLGK